MNRVLLIAAIICAVIAAAMGFGWIDDPHAVGWLGTALAFGFASELAP